MRGVASLLLLSLMLAGCGYASASEPNVVGDVQANAAADDELNAMATSDASIYGPGAIAVDDTVYPGHNAAAADIVEGQVIQLTEEGLGVGSMGLHLAQFYDFGQPRDLVMAMAVNMRGAPSRTGRDETCRLGPIDWAEFGNIRLNFQQGRFVGWHALRAPGRPVTDNDGFSLGSERRDISFYGDDVIHYRWTARGYEFDSGLYHGVLSSARANARVTDLWAGMICEAP